MEGKVWCYGCGAMRPTYRNGRGELRCGKCGQAPEGRSDVTAPPAKDTGLEPIGPIAQRVLADLMPDAPKEADIEPPLPVLDRARTDEVIGASIKHAEQSPSADDAWRARFLAAAQRVCKRLPEFTVDDIWEELGEEPDSHAQGSVAGPLMLRLKAERWAKATDERRDSIRPATHGKPQRVWVSLRHQEAA